jgi:hypothetical protein
MPCILPHAFFCPQFSFSWAYCLLNSLCSVAVAFLRGCCTPVKSPADTTSTGATNDPGREGKKGEVGSSRWSCHAPTDASRQIRLAILVQLYARHQKYIPLLLLLVEGTDARPEIGLFLQIFIVRPKRRLIRTKLNSAPSFAKSICIL